VTTMSAAAVHCAN